MTADAQVGKRMSREGRAYRRGQSISLTHSVVAYVERGVLDHGALHAVGVNPVCVEDPPSGSWRHPGDVEMVTLEWSVQSGEFWKFTSRTWTSVTLLIMIDVAGHAHCAAASTSGAIGHN